DEPLRARSPYARQKTGKNAAKVELRDTAKRHHRRDQRRVDADLRDRVEPCSEHPVDEPQYRRHPGASDEGVAVTDQRRPEIGKCRPQAGASNGQGGVPRARAFNRQSTSCPPRAYSTNNPPERVESSGANPPPRPD